MSVRAMTWAFYDSRAKGLDKLVLLAIADHVHDDGRDAYPSIETLARKCGIGKATVIRSIHSLETLGDLGVERHGRGRGRMHTYRLLMEKRSAPDLSRDGRPQDPSYPQASSPQPEKVQKRSAGDQKKGPSSDPPMENRIREPEPPARARAKSGNPRDLSTAPPSPGYRHDHNPGHDPDPTRCAACGTATRPHDGKPRVPEQAKRSWRDQLGLPWPDGPAPTPPDVDEEAERQRVLAELANLEHPDAFPKTPPTTRAERTRHAP
jgi:Helix-turn-helix domain